jgi:hypothetical protein
MTWDLQIETEVSKQVENCPCAPKLPWAEVAGPIWDFSRIFVPLDLFVRSSPKPSLRRRDSPATAELKLRELVTFLVKTTCGLAGGCHFILSFRLLEVGLRLQCRQNDGGRLLNHFKAFG